MDAFLIAKMEKLLVDRLVYFWLSPSGKEAVKQVFEGKEAFKAYVESVSELGVWLRLPAKKRRSGPRFAIVVEVGIFGNSAG